MTTPPSANQKLATPHNNVELSFEEKLHLFWEKNRNAVYAFCVLVLVAILAKEGWIYFGNKRQESISEAYAVAASPEKLRVFANENPGQPLAGLAHLTLADESYAAGKFSDAAADYELAASMLKIPVFVGRAQLGLAISLVQAGQNTKGEPLLKQLADDTTQLKTFRAEAAYNLASLAAEAGRADDAKKYANVVLQLDASGTWAQRALMLQASLPASTPSSTPVAEETKGSGISIKLPGSK